MRGLRHRRRYEAMARDNVTTGDLGLVAAWKAKALAALDLVADPDDRKLIQGTSTRSREVGRLH